MALSTVALAGWIRDVLLVREGMQLTRDVADERARNIAGQIGEILAQTKCRCGRMGTVNGDLCADCYMGDEWPTGEQLSDDADRAAEETLPPEEEDGSASVRV
jgi:hypothetical protein